MPSMRSILAAAVVGLITSAAAMPSVPRLSEQAVRRYENVKRQNALATAAGINDIDIAQFALTLEHLENAFYNQGFTKFPDSDFAALGLSPEDITNLKSIGKSEEEHVITLNSFIASAGIKPVEPCTYNFGFTDAAGMVATASVLENVGVSAYLGAAPLVASPAVLTLAAQIVTVEARHQTFVRVATKAAAIPSPFDTPLGVKSVFTLAAGFITACPEGSNLKLTAFPALTQTDPKAKITVDSKLLLTTTATDGKFCAFTNGGAAGGSLFTAFADGGCQVPQTLKGQTYVSLTKSKPNSQVVTDDIVVAGVLVAVIT